MTQRHIKTVWEEAKKRSRKFYIESTRRLGKSSFLLTLFAEECLKSGNRKCGFFAPVKEGLLDYIEPLIAKTFEDCPEDVMPFFDKQRCMLRFKNGSVIVFRGSNNQQHRVRRGQEFNIAGIDEARDVDSLDSLVESVVFPSLFSTDGYMILSSTPADTRSHPLYFYKTQAELEGWIVRITMDDASRMDPGAYPQERIKEWREETLKHLDGQDIWDREYNCKWIVNRRKMAVPEWKSEYVCSPKKDAYYQFYHHYVGLDWGYRDYTALIFGTWMFRKDRFVQEGELTFSGHEVRSDMIAEAVRLMMRKLWNGAEAYRMISDSADPILINEINRYEGMNFTPVAKAHTLEAMLNEFRVMVSQGKYLVRPECPMTIHSLGNAVWDDQRKKLDKDVLAHHFDHLMAAVYAARMMDTATNPIPGDFAVDGIRVIDLGGHDGKSETARELEKIFGGMNGNR